MHVFVIVHSPGLLYLALENKAERESLVKLIPMIAIVKKALAHSEWSLIAWKGAMIQTLVFIIYTVSAWLTPKVSCFIDFRVHVTTCSQDIFAGIFPTLWSVNNVLINSEAVMSPSALHVAIQVFYSCCLWATFHFYLNIPNAALMTQHKTNLHSPSTFWPLWLVILLILL